MKVLITGADGQLGKDCLALLSPKYQVTAVDIDGLDIAEANTVDKAIKTLGPDVIVNCAAYTRVDACESDFEKAWQANSEGPANLAKAAARNGTRLIHISTDYVFDGKKPVPEGYTESDTPSPMSVYGSTKLAGEERIMEAMDNYVIFRTAWLYGLHGQNFIRTILGKLLNEPENRLHIVDDQYGSPTWSYRLARQIDHLLATAARGIYHASAEGYCTWYELAAEICREMAIPCRIDACATKDYPTPAARPQNSILENHHLKSEKSNRMIHWHEDLKAFLAAHGRALAAAVGRKTGEAAS